ncbi:uncharacterized protein LOC124314774 [Daphnia pulicaria]|uniref:uncharacterized protein LOC124314774 n=1 Tax=Daphnia pulicaria TaxID=35523 RepID=UPI001EE9EB95|nr:uncharacterized protein LOC124314774 [Daphnia pulicaria]
MDFGSFADDFFESEECDNKEISSQFHWIAHRSEAGWFHEVCESASEGDVTFNIKHLRANHLYYTGRYVEAANTFTELLKLLRTGNHQREVSEGLCRSHLKLGDFKMALEAANQFKLSCKSEAHFSSYHMMCGEIHQKNLDFQQELIHLQQAIKIHPTNSEMWLKTAECYGHISQIDIYDVPFPLSKDKDTTWFAAASLLRVDIILKSLAGRESFGNLKKKRNQKLQNLVHPIVASLPKNFTAKAHEALSRDVYNIESQTQDETEFVDLGSSKQEKPVECESDELIVAMGSESQKDWFEKQWFSFVDSIQENMYYIPPDNTQTDVVLNAL